MEKKLILRGALAGGLGGLLAFVFARIFAEPLIQQAIDYEEGRGEAQEKLDRAAGLAVGGHEHEIFSRTIQADVGIGVGLIVFGVALGALFAVAYVICIGRTGNIRPRALALLVAAAGFVGFYLVPFMKYPANPPAVGNDDTIVQRTQLYLIMVAASLILMFVAVVLGQRLAKRIGTWPASMWAGLGFLVAVGVVMLVLPPLGHLDANVAEAGKRATETPLPLRDPEGNIVFPGFPADVLAKFRVYSVTAQLILWATIGLVFAPLADRLLTGKRSGSARVEETSAA
ncbi:hypothetical protein GCM10011519_25440 [Marmoricola endophyticus]|uniref:Cobalt transporter n=1 Tax=Marmoricola endophyticus TaxID=2040280 RepID=A0A917BL65_9ACTN|nr:CbtA family protein [Marmoricola endophyticus]GGF50407.1 hypothetical protein GCM10011519_25440 [Marmoricola endophyticus]